MAVVGLSTSVFGQGQVTLANNSSTLITSAATSLPVAVGSASFQLLAGADSGSLAAVGPVVGTSAGVGRIANTIISGMTSILPDGQLITFRVQAWSSAFASYALALAGNGEVGQSVIFTSSASVQLPGDPPPTPVSLAGKYAGFQIAQVPEPSTIALGIMGAGSLLFLRRKK